MNANGWLVEVATWCGSWRAGLALVVALGALASAALSGEEARNASLLDVWDKIEAPAPPQLKPVRLAPKTAALLILDVETRTANAERRPRAVASVPRIAALLAKARAAGMPVAYSLTRSGTPETILREVAPREGEPIVQASVDKFHRTELEAFLKRKGVKTVLIVGTSAEGAVLHTATGAALRGFDVVVPIDGMSSSHLYAEQYTAWHLANAPGSRRRTTLTATSLVRFGE